MSKGYVTDAKIQDQPNKYVYEAGNYKLRHILFSPVFKRVMPVCRKNTAHTFYVSHRTEFNAIGLHHLPPRAQSNLVIADQRMV